jgi:hypothetical protein
MPKLFFNKPSQKNLSPAMLQMTYEHGADLRPVPIVVRDIYGKLEGAGTGVESVLRSRELIHQYIQHCQRNGIIPTDFSVMTDDQALAFCGALENIEYAIEQKLPPPSESMDIVVKSMSNKPGKLFTKSAGNEPGKLLIKSGSSKNALAYVDQLPSQLSLDPSISMLVNELETMARNASHA